MRVFIDTNVLIDVLARREEFYEESAAIWSLAETGRITGLIAATSMTNIYYIVRRLSGRDAAMKALCLLRDSFECVACDAQVLNQAIDSGMTDFEDAVQAKSALHGQAQVLVTRDAKHFADCGVAIATPHDLLALLHEKQG